MTALPTILAATPVVVLGRPGKHTSLGVFGLLRSMLAPRRLSPP